MLREAVGAVHWRAGSAAYAEVLTGITAPQLAFAELAQAHAEVAAAEGTACGSTVIGAMPLARSVLVPRAILEFAALRPCSERRLRSSADRKSVV